MEPLTVISGLTILAKLVKLGMDTRDAHTNADFDDDDLGVITDALSMSDAAKLAKDRRATPVVEARHLALVMAAFGRALASHRDATPALEKPSRLRRFLDQEERARDKDIQTRLRLAGLAPEGQTAEPADLDALVGSPLRTPYYRKLWQAFSDPGYNVDMEGAEPPLGDLDGAARRRFEKGFLAAYREALAAPAGAEVRAYLDGLKEQRPRMVRERLIEDMATWDERHVFGNLRRDQWDDALLPFLPLGRMYVQPFAAQVDGGKREIPRPVLNVLHEILSAARGPYITVVKGDFGKGKSLTARILVCELATLYLNHPTKPSDELWLPIFVRCGDDMHDGKDLKSTVSRALRRHARDLGMDYGLNDPAFALPGPEARVLIVLDGLDEVVLGQQVLDHLFRSLRDLAGDRCRVLVMSRPGVLPDRNELKDVALVELQDFSARDPNYQPGGQVAEWLKAWNEATGRAQPVTAAEVDRRGLLELAQTPILLLMIAQTWDAHATSEPISRARLYETFLQQVARGKHERDRDRHTPVHDAALALRDRLFREHEIGDNAEPHEAMLWLLARLAWKQRQWDWKQRMDRRARGGDSADDAPEPLTRRQVEDVLRDELRLSKDVADTVEMGVVLTLQTDPTMGRDHIHFGHKSFGEFLVARYWADRLRKLAEVPGQRWDEHVDRLLDARLLLPDDQSFELLMEILFDGAPDSAPPFAWDRDLRGRVRGWAEHCFNDEAQVFAGSKSTCIRDDRRAVLREAALAIGSRISLHDRTPGLRARSPWVMRSLLAWFWSTREPVRIIAPRAELPGIHACATYREADFREANLEGAVFDGARLINARFQKANFSGASLGGANLGGANLGDANLGGANLKGVNLGFANLGGANLEGANLKGAIFNDATKWPPKFDPNAADAIDAHTYEGTFF